MRPTSHRKPFHQTNHQQRPDAKLATTKNDHPCETDHRHPQTRKNKTSTTSGFNTSQTNAFTCSKTWEILEARVAGHLSTPQVPKPQEPNQSRMKTRANTTKLSRNLRELMKVTQLNNKATQHLTAHEADQARTPLPSFSTKFHLKTQERVPQQASDTEGKDKTRERRKIRRFTASESPRRHLNHIRHLDVNLHSITRKERKANHPSLQKTHNAQTREKKWPSKKELVAFKL